MQVPNKPVTLTPQPENSISEEQWQEWEKQHKRETYADYCIPDEEYERD